MTPTEHIVRKAFTDQARWCRSMGSDLMALLCDTVAENLDSSTAVGRRILTHEGVPDAMGDALPLRFAGALHALVRSGTEPELAGLYPPNLLPTSEVLWSCLADLLVSRESHLLTWLEQPPQTNEVARSAILMAGLLEITARFGLPLDLYELGASAGLNLMLDRYAYRLGAHAFGDVQNGVVLEPEWRGGPAPVAEVTVVARQGVDIHPIDVTDVADRERLVAYVWPDQPERLSRMEAAIAVALQDPPRVTQGDAADWLEDRLSAAPQAGVARVVMSSIAEQYFPDASRRRIAACLKGAGETASSETPLAWLRFEMDPELEGPPALRLTLWPGGEERLLARAHAHCQWIEWLG